MAKNKITDIAEKIFAQYLEEQDDKDLSLYHVEYVKEGPDMILRVFIDRDEGYIDTEDCEKVSRFFSEKLDEADPIEKNYILEVSSPGLDRVLVNPEHFERYMGELIEVSLYKEVEGQKKLEGRLIEYQDGAIKIAILTDGEEKIMTFEPKDMAKVNLAVVI